MAEIDWEQAERAAIQAEGEPEEPGPEAKAAAMEIPEGERPPIETVIGPAGPVQTPEVAPAPRPPFTRLQMMREKLLQTAPRVAGIAPGGANLERLFAVAYVALERNPGLLECTPISILRGIIVGAQLGLDVSGIGGMAYLVPYFNSKTRQKEAVFIPGYRGLIDLARRSGEIAYIAPGIVYTGDPEFQFQVDPFPRLFHKPQVDPAKRGEPVAAYAVAVFRDKAVPPFPWVVAKPEIEKIRDVVLSKMTSPAGPWITDELSMWMKTAIRALCKYLPWSPDLNHALDAEERGEEGTFTLPGELPAGEGEPAPEEMPRGASATIAKKLRGRRSKPAKP